MNKTILYFIDLGNYTKLIYENCEKLIKKKYRKILNEECLNYLTTLSGRIDAMSKLLETSYNVPLYINKEICFIKIEKDKWVNINNVEKITAEYIIFKSGKVLNFNRRKQSIRQKINKVNDVLKLIKK